MKFMCASASGRSEIIPISTSQSLINQNKCLRELLMQQHQARNVDIKDLLMMCSSAHTLINFVLYKAVNKN